MSSFQADNFKQSRKVRISAPVVQWSRRSIVALALGVVAWAVPLAPIVVLVLAATAWIAIRRAPKNNLQLRGTPLAYGAMGLGLAGCVFQGYVGARGFAAYEQLRCGPSDAIALGLGGDVPGFLEAFPPAPSQADAAEMFLGELETRYGPLVHAKPQSSPEFTAAFSDHPSPQSYRLQFARGIVTAHATWQTPPAGGLHWPATPHIESLTIEDPNHGALVFPETRLSEVVP